MRSLLLLCLAAAVASSTPFAEDERFLPLFPYPQFAVGEDPDRHLAVDLDGDGALDLLMRDLTGDELQLAFGDGAGSLGSPIAINPVLQMNDVDVGDFDGNGFADVVGIDSTLETAFLLAGDASLQYAQSATVSVPNAPGSLLPPRDVDGDGNLDVILGDALGAVLIRGDGAGGFHSPVPLSLTGADARYADFNGDGFDDAVTLANGDFLIWLHDGSGDFVPGPALSDPGPYSSIAVGDWNGDEHADILTHKTGGVFLRVFLGDGTGAFPALVDTQVGTTVTGVVRVDLGGDGALDAVLQSSEPSPAGVQFITCATGDGLGGFTLGPKRYPDTGFLGSSLVTGDFDGDGQEDLCLRNRPKCRVTFIFGDGEGDVRSPNRVRLGNLEGLASADIDGDGLVDGITVSGRIQPNQLDVLLADGSGGFSKIVVLLPNLGLPNDIDAGDLDGVAGADVAVAEGASLTRVLFPGPPPSIVIENFPTPSGGDIHHVIISDVDGDGIGDVIASTYDPDEILILRGTSSTFDAPLAVTSEDPGEVAHFDLDNDGVLDLVVGAGGGSSPFVLLFYRGLGGGSFASPTAISVAGNFSCLNPGDLNGDGAVDLVGNARFSSLVYVWLNDGAGGLDDTIYTSSVGNSAVGLALADMDNDGDTDVVFGTNSIHVLLNDGAGGMTLKAESYAANFISAEIAVADFNADGRQDVMVAANFNIFSALTFFQETVGAKVAPYGEGVNPPDSLVVLSGLPAVGQSMSVGIDNPLGTQAAGSLGYLGISLGPAPGFPNGLLLPRFGMSGGQAELLVDLTPGQLQQPFLGGNAWSGSGQPLAVPLNIPPIAELIGCPIFAQGFLLDSSPGTSVRIGLTSGLRLVLGGN